MVGRKETVLVGWAEMRSRVRDVQARLAAQAGALVDTLDGDDDDGTVERLTLIEALARHHALDFRALMVEVEYRGGCADCDGRAGEVPAEAGEGLLACEALLGEFRGVYRLLVEWAIRRDELRVGERIARYLRDLDELEQDYHPVHRHLFRMVDAHRIRARAWSAIQKRIESDRTNVPCSS